jgi:adenosylcobinamide-GDP ribazoletransferase
MTVVNPLAGLTSVILSALALLLLFFISKKQFGGMSGDLSGWFLCIAEIMMLAGLTVISLAK